jgi:hypothetical protein
MNEGVASFCRWRGKDPREYSLFPHGKIKPPSSILIALPNPLNWPKRGGMRQPSKFGLDGRHWWCGPGLLHHYLGMVDHWMGLECVHVSLRPKFVRLVVLCSFCLCLFGPKWGNGFSFIFLFVLSPFLVYFHPCLLQMSNSPKPMKIVSSKSLLLGLVFVRIDFI